MTRSWVWLFVDSKTMKCSKCDVIIGGNFSTNAKNHLKSHHNITEGCSEYTLAIEESLKKELEQAKQPRLSVVVDKRAMTELHLDYCIRFGIPVARCEDKYFRACHPTLPICRVTFRAKLLDHANMRHAAALRKLDGRRCTLAYDSGTIWNKYMCIVVCSGQMPPLVYAVTECDSATALWTRELLEKALPGALAAAVR